MPFQREPGDYAFELAQQYSSHSAICPCKSHHTFEICHTNVVQMSVGYVILKGSIRRDGLTYRDGFAGKSFQSLRCAHDIEREVTVRVNSDQWDHVACKTSQFVIVNGLLVAGVIDTTTPISGVMSCPDSRIQIPGPEINACEIFSGGFSGWTHAMRRLTDMGFPFRHLLAVDDDQCCRETFMKSHGFQHLVGPNEYIWGSDPIPSNVFVQADVTSHAWKHLLGNAIVDVLLMSPPCPPWSHASWQQGLFKEEGRLTLHAWGLVQLLKPKIVLMEMVAGMRDHPHWKTVRDFMTWSGYSLRYCRTSNLMEISPQQRERLIILATRDDAELFPHLPVGWPPMQRQTLHSYLNIMYDLDEPWKSQSMLGDDLLQMYLDPDMLPRMNDRKGHAIKRTKRDVESYRIRYPHGTFGCIMSNYGYGHLLPDSTLKHGGLYGTLIALPSGLRFMSVPEVLIAQTALASCWMPMDHRACMKMLGNAIATPHALLGLTNVIAFFHELGGIEAQELMTEALTKRMTSQNIQWELRHDGYVFEVDDDVCAPTMMMHAAQKVSIQSPMHVTAFHAEQGVNVVHALKVLLTDAMPNEVYLMPGGKIESKIALHPQMTVTNESIRLYAYVPSALNISSDAFASTSHDAELIVVLTIHGPYVLRRDHGMTVQDVITIVDHSLEIRCSHLTGMLGERHSSVMICPDAVFARDVETAADDLQVLDFIRVKVNDEGVKFAGDFPLLKEFWEFLYRTALIEIIHSLGWALVTDAQNVVDRRVDNFVLVPKLACLSVTLHDLVQCLALHLYVIKIRTWQTLGDQPSVPCKIKLLHVWVWNSMIDPYITLRHFDIEWKKICEKFGIQRPWRFVAGGRQLNPEWPVAGFVQNDSDGSFGLTVFMVAGLHGGGPVKLVSSKVVEDSGNFRDIPHMEETDFEGALSVALQTIVNNGQPLMRCDISDFLMLEGSTKEGFYGFDGEAETLRKLLIVLKETGIEEMLKKCGWLMACQFMRIEPVRMRIIFVEMPLVPTSTIELLVAALRSSFVCIGMPVPTQGIDDVSTKIKLWNVPIFKGKLPRMFAMQELLDIWDQACTIVGDHFNVRIVSHVGTVNPDMALKHYTRCGEDNTTVTSLVFVGELRGGGPVDKKATNPHDFAIQQKNALATFMLAQGADLKDSVNFIESILRGAGPAAVESILGQKQITKRWEGLAQLAMAIHVPMPPFLEKISNAKKKVQKRIATQVKSMPAHVPIESLTLERGFIRNADDTDCQQISRMTPNSSGVVLMYYDDARQWLEKSLVLSQDELALVIIGDCKHADKSKCNRLQLPVNLAGEPLLLQACLHQMGAKLTKFASDGDEEIPITDTHVVSFTAGKEDLTK